MQSLIHTQTHTHRHTHKDTDTHTHTHIDTDTHCSPREATTWFCSCFRYERRTHNHNTIVKTHNVHTHTPLSFHPLFLQNLRHSQCHSQSSLLPFSHSMGELGVLYKEKQ